MSISKGICHLAKASEHSWILGGIPGPCRVCRFAPTAQIIKQYITFYFGTGKWASLYGAQARSNRPWWTLSSIIPFCTAMTVLGILNAQSFQALWVDPSRIQWGCSILSRIIPCSCHVHVGAYSLLDSIPRSASLSCGLSMVSITSSHNLSGVNHTWIALWKMLRTNHSSEGPGIGTAWALPLSLQSKAAYGVLTSDNGIGFTFLPTHF